MSTSVRFSPWAPLGLMGAAGGLELLRRGVLPTQLTEDMKRFSEHTKLRQDMGYDMAVPEASRALHNLADYAIQGNKIMSARIAGLRPIDIVKAFRSSPLVAEKDKWVPGISDLHYRAFEQGPLPAYNHLLSELTYGWKTDDINVPAVRTSALGNVASVLRNYLGIKVGKPANIRDDIRAQINALVRDNTGVGDYLNTTVGPTTWDHAATATPAKISPTEQIKVIRSLPGKLTGHGGALTGIVGEDSDRFARNVAGVQDVLYRNYSKFIQPVLLADNVWKNVNIGLASLGGLGLGAYGLNRYLHYRDDKERREKRARVDVPQSDIRDEPPPTKRNWLLPAALLSGAAGAGALAFRHGALPDTFLEQLRNFRTISTGKAGDLKDAARALGEYSVGGANIMRHKLFNLLPVKSVMRALRSIPGLSPEDRWNPESDAHYTTFGKGPVHGFLRYFEELYDDYANPNPTSIQRTIYGAVPAHKIRDEAIASLNKLTGEHTGVRNYFDSKGMKDWAEHTGPALDDASQSRIMQDLPQWLVDNKSQFPYFTKELAGRQGAVAESLRKYRTKLIDPVLTAAKVMDNIGYAGLGGAGILGLGALKAQHDNEETAKRRQLGASRPIFNSVTPP